MAMVRICSLWKQKKKDGGIFYAGRTQLPEIIIPTDGSLFVFPVKSKRSEKSPDATLMVAIGEEKQQRKSSQEEEGPDMFDGSEPETDDEFEDEGEGEEGGEDLDEDI